MKQRLPRGEITLQEIAAAYPALALVAGSTMRLDPVDPETAEWLDGPSFVKWLRKRGRRPDTFEGSLPRRVREWEQGSAVPLHFVDRILINMEMSLHDLPDEMWVRPPVVLDHVTEAGKQEAIRRYNGGESLASLSDEFSVTRDSIKNWATRS